MTRFFRAKWLKVAVIVLAFLGAYTLGFGTAASVDHGWIGRQITSAVYSKGQPEKTDFSLLWQTWNEVHQKYVGTPDDQKLVYGSIKGMVAGLGDPYTVFFDPDEAKRFMEDIQGKFYGIGIEVGINNKALTVIAPLDETPAQKAGIKTGDIILKIDGKDVGDLTLDDAVSHIRGPQGSKVKLTILTKSSGEIKDMEIVRDLIKVKSVKWEVKDGNIGYVRISQFSDDTVDLANQALTEFNNKQVIGVVLDLRNDPGGYIEGAQGIASMFVSPGVVVSQQGKAANDKQDLFTVGSAIMPNTPLVVLVNGGSASASEIVAGAIQDRGRGKLVGEKTFGKGSVQTISNLPGGASLKVTIAHWLTPNGRMIDKQGIKPDVEVTMTADDEKAGRDPQLDKALSILKGQ